MKIMILEGLDGSGKTTIAKEVAKRLNIDENRLPNYNNKSGKIIEKIIGNGKKNVTEEEFQSSMLENYLESIKEWKKKGKDMIITRAGMSMLAYASYFDPEGYENKVYDRNVEMFYSVLMENDIQISNIFISVDKEVAEERVKNRGDVVEVFENNSVQSHVKKKYDEFLENGILIEVKNNGTIDEAVDNVIELFNKDNSWFL